jgi:prepilin-type N-terminal cleavage/methylation domain-containing protein
MRKIKQAGYSLIELLVVLAIVGTLVGIAVPMFGDYSTTAYGAEAVNNIHTLEVALSDYYVDNGTYVAGEYNASGAKTLESGPLAWTPGEDDANQQYKYEVKQSASCSNNIAICYEIVATGLGRKVPTTEIVRKPSDGKIVYEQTP